MKIAIMQPYFLPYIGYFQLINSVDKFIFYNDVNFINKGWINRNFILLNNEPHLINIPLQGASQNRLIKDINICHDEKWKKKMLKTIEQAYRKAPHFIEIYRLLESIIYSKCQTISELNILAIDEIMQILGMKTKLIIDSSIYNNSHLSGQSRILDICIKENANFYHNAIGGKEIYEKISFEKLNIELKFVENKLTAYSQFNNQFSRGLSIIDALMFNDSGFIMNNLMGFDLV